MKHYQGQAVAKFTTIVGRFWFWWFWTSHIIIILLTSTTKTTNSWIGGKKHQREPSCVSLSSIWILTTFYESNFGHFRNHDRRSKMISAPSNFNHISHMGPGDGIQIQRLMDLPTTVETADSTPQPSAAIPANPQPPRAKALYTTPPLGGANKLTPGSRLPQQPGPPQRSISHNEVIEICCEAFS